MAKALTPFFLRTVALIREIPRGKVVTYGQVAQLIGASGCARQVSFVLSSSSKKYKLPWQRVIGASGKVSSFSGSFRQTNLLKREGVVLESNFVDMDRFQWRPTKTDVKKILKNIPAHEPKY